MESTKTMLFRIVIIMALGVLYLAKCVNAVEPPALIADKEKAITDWDAQSSFSLLFNGGNNSLLTLGTKNKIDVRLFNIYKVKTDIDAFSSRSNGITTSEEYTVDTKVGQQVWRWFGSFSSFKWHRARLLGIRNQQTVTLGADGIWVINEIHNVGSSLGFSYRYESRMNRPVKQSPNAQITGEYQVKLLNNTKLESDVEMIFNLDDKEAWEMEWVTGLRFRLTDKLSLTNSYTLKYRNQPVSGFRPGDHKYSLGLIIDWR